MNRDQKQLELLYEQVTESYAFNLLPEEEKYFENVINFYLHRFETNPRIREFMRKGSSSVALVTMLNGYERPAPFSQFCKEGLGSKEKVLNSFYNTNILGFNESFIYLKKIKANDGKKVLAFEFSNLNSSDSKLKQIPLTDTQILREKLKESLVNSLKHFVFPTRHMKGNYEEVWFNWRADIVKYKALKEKLPELEGVF